MHMPVNIEEELSILWQHIYADIVFFAKENGLINCNIEISIRIVKFLIVDYEGIIYFKCYDGKVCYPEDLEDNILYEVHSQIFNGYIEK